MKSKKIFLNFRRKKIKMNVFECNALERFVGLMFSSKRNAKILLFDFKKPTREGIHSFFVFYSFVAIWLDNKNKVIERKIVKPFTFLERPKTKFYKLVEIPINFNYRREIKFLNL